MSKHFSSRHYALLGILEFLIVLTGIGIFPVGAYQVNSNLLETETSFIKWSPDSSKLAVIRSDVAYVDGEEQYINPRIEILNSSTNQILLTIEEDATELAWRPGADEIATGGFDSMVRRWNTLNGQLIASYQHSSASMLAGENIPIPAITVAYNSTGTILASTGFDNVVKFWDISTGNLTGTINLDTPTTMGLDHAVSWMGWNSNSSRFAVTNWDGKLRIWQSTAANPIFELSGHVGALTHGVWSPDNSKLATSSYDQSVRIWDATTGNNLLVLQGHTDKVGTVCWSPDGNYLASASADGTIRIWNAVTGQQTNLIQSTTDIWALDWSADGRLAYGPRIMYDPNNPSTPQPPIIGTPPPAPTATPTPSPTPTSGAFPATSVLDDFNRADGPIGSNWSIAPGGYSILNNRLDIGSGGSILWSPSAFGANQEAFITLTTPDTDAEEIDLLLKHQFTGASYHVIEVWYQPTLSIIQVWTHDPANGWVQRGADIPVTFAAGDQFGARAKADGAVEVYRNGQLLASRDLSGWAYAADGGAIGLWLVSAGDGDLDDFGGGDVP